MTKTNIPIFIAHRGCQNSCVFCNQNNITGTEDGVTGEKARSLIEEGLLRSDRDELEIAYFGGSFTGIPICEQNELLAVAKEYVDNGKVRGIRLSTRPDYINEDIVDNLLKYGVTTVELGAQSMDEEVLVLAKRGHTAEDVIKASRLIKEKGIELGLQMMTGLPKATRESDINTCREFIKLMPSQVRIYPTLVLRGTCLCDMYEKGEYTPQTLEDAVDLCAELTEMFEEKGINVIRTGLQPSESLEQSFVAGPYHPSFGELTQSRVILKRVLGEIENNEEGQIVLKAEKKLMSKLVGQKRCNVREIQKKTGKNVLIEEAFDGSGIVIGANRIYG